MTILYKPRRKRRSGRMRIALTFFALGIASYHFTLSRTLKTQNMEAFRDAVREEATFQLALIIQGDEYSPELHAPERKP